MYECVDQIHIFRSYYAPDLFVITIALPTEPLMQIVVNLIQMALSMLLREL